MHALSVKGLTKTYKNGVQALKGIDLDVAEGDFFALLGPDGAGKTTLVGIVTSLVTNRRGRSACSARHRPRPDRAKSCIGIVPQEINFNMFESPETIVVHQAGFYGVERTVARQRAEKYLKQLQLWEKRKGIARALSGGMKRRLMIARALMHEPKLLILDEPTAGVDIEIRRSMWEFLREINEQGTTIILTTHIWKRPKVSAATSPSSTAPHHRAGWHERAAAPVADRELSAESRQADNDAAGARGLSAGARGRPHAGGGGPKGQTLNDIFARLSARASKYSRCATR